MVHFLCKINWLLTFAFCSSELSNWSWVFFLILGHLCMSRLTRILFYDDINVRRIFHLFFDPFYKSFNQLYRLTWVLFSIIRCSHKLAEKMSFYLKISSLDEWKSSRVGKSTVMKSSSISRRMNRLVFSILYAAYVSSWLKY